MKERPIIFGAESVRAILAGTKTQTRRVMKPSHVHAVRKPSDGDLADVGRFEHAEGRLRAYLAAWPGVSIGEARCPYGAPGDRLWVREAWWPDAPCDDTWDSTSFYGCKGASLDLIPERYRKPEHVLYRATWTGTAGNWRSPIFMPRWASRITLEVTQVRVQRLQEITEEDARAEGLSWVAPSYGVPGLAASWLPRARDAFAVAWDSINAKRGFGWDKNPWVWVVNFRRDCPEHGA